MKTTAKLPPEVAERLGPYYVYLLLDPRHRDRPFYVGKGTGQRLTDHGRKALEAPEPGEPEKARTIRAIRDAGLELKVDVVRHGISTEQQAYDIEAALIDTLPYLVNQVRGKDVDQGRQSLDELLRLHGAPPLKTREPLLLVRLTNWIDAPDTSVKRRGHGFQPGMAPRDVYASTRAWWKVSPEQVEERQIRHALAVYRGVSRGLFTIDSRLSPREDGRRAFVGRVLTAGQLWNATVGQLGYRVTFTKHAQNPIAYWPR